MDRVHTRLFFRFLLVGLLALTALPASAQNYSVTADPATVTIGETINVQWTAPAGSSWTDWIGLYKVGESNFSYRWYKYTGGAASGSIAVAAPLETGNYEFRYLLNNGYTDAARSSAVEVVSSFTVTASTSTVTAGQPLSVSWTAPAGRPYYDWIGLYKVGASNYAYGWWRYTEGAASGTFNLNAPTETGDYEFRYLLNNGYSSAAKSAKITVQAANANYTVTATPGNVVAGDTITVNFTAPSGRPWYDWIGMFKVGTTNYAYGWWAYTNGQTSGSFSVKAPAEPGDYEFRYLLNNGYTDSARSGVVTVGVGNTNYSLTPSATSVKAGSALSVTWTAPAGRPYTDWIGLYRVGDSNFQYGWWTYTGGAASGTANLTAPLQTGSYEFRYLLNNGYTDALKSVTITVTP